ncbi:MAG: UDP-N-acetylmuramoyl-L-alanyl-D-glutamate--2,6-diaminopimelate ligase [Gammaproteobacteria bacterium]
MTAALGTTTLPLSALLSGIGPVPAAVDRDVHDITLDSREVVPGSCFIALRGSREHAYSSYAADARARGAAAIVTDDGDGDAAAVSDVPVVRVPALRRHLGEIANRFFDTPSAAMRVIGITGTNGKTTVAYLTAQAVARFDGACAYIGTLGAGLLGALTPTRNTTPDIITINRWLARFRAQGVTTTTLEASSHALDQGRLDGLRVKAAAFTNLGRDHLDYHRDLAHYEASKRRLFEQPGLAAAAINIDDPSGATLAADLQARLEVWSCSAAAPAAARVSARAIAATLHGTRFDIGVADRWHRIDSRLIGHFNVDNLLLTAALLLALDRDSDRDMERIAACLSALGPVPGRMEACGVSASGAHVLIDFAHTPDGLSAALASLRDVGANRIGVVFGCGGDRDRGKRPLMAAAVERYADWMIVTADNPRSENLADINAAISDGFSAAADFLIIDDRAEAIRAAVARAGRDDIVLIAGKGDESTQESGGLQLPFSDREQVRAALREVTA